MRLHLLLAAVAVLTWSCERYDHSRVGDGVRQNWQSDSRIALTINSTRVANDSLTLDMTLSNRDTIERLVVRPNIARGVEDEAWGMWITGCGKVSRVHWTHEDGSTDKLDRFAFKPTEAEGFRMAPGASATWHVSFPLGEMSLDDPTCYDSVQVALELDKLPYKSRPPSLFIGRVLSTWARIYRPGETSP